MFDQPDPARRVLITGTHAGALRYMARGLAIAGYDVETASTQGDAGVRAALQPPDALILDVDMPDGSAIDLCREIRGWSDAVVLLTSRSSTERMIVAGLDAGADDFLTAPVGLQELYARLRAGRRPKRLSQRLSRVATWRLHASDRRRRRCLAIRFGGSFIHEHRHVDRSSVPPAHRPALPFVRLFDLGICRSADPLSDVLGRAAVGEPEPAVHRARRAA